MHGTTQGSAYGAAAAPRLAAGVPLQGRQAVTQHTTARLAVCSLVLMLAGCATPRQLILTRPGATEADYKQDSYVCELETRQNNLPRPPQIARNEEAATRMYRGFFQRCMEARGWTVTPPQPQPQQATPPNEEKTP